MPRYVPAGEGGGGVRGVYIDRCITEDDWLKTRAFGSHISSFGADKNLPIFSQKGLERLLL